MHYYGIYLQELIGVFFWQPGTENLRLNIEEFLSELNSLKSLLIICLLSVTLVPKEIFMFFFILLCRCQMMTHHRAF